MRRVEVLLLVFGIATPALDAADGPNVQELIQRSVANNERNWKGAPSFSFHEEDVTTQGGQSVRKSYHVTLIEGSPYNELVARNGEPLQGTEAAAEREKLAREKERRRSESPAARGRRVAQYERERQQDHALMTEMVKAFDFRLAGRETVAGRDSWVLDAAPKPGYQPRNRDTKVLTGMKGRMWIDSHEYQWVRVHAEVFRPVPFGLFIAHVRPGTEFTLDEAPVGGGIWMPARLVTKVHSTALRVWSKNSTEDERYSDYRRTEATARVMR